MTRFTLRDMMERGESEEELDQVQLMTLHASKGLEFPTYSRWAWKRACCRTRAASMKTMSMKSGVWPMWGSPARKRADLHPVPRAPSVRRTGAAGAEPLPAGTAAGRFGVGNRAQSGEPAGADAEGAEPSGQYPRPAGQGQRRELKTGRESRPVISTLFFQPQRPVDVALPVAFLLQRLGAQRMLFQPTRR